MGRCERLKVSSARLCSSLMASILWLTWSGRSAAASSCEAAGRGVLAWGACSGPDTWSSRSGLMGALLAGCSCALVHGRSPRGAHQQHAYHDPDTLESLP